MSENRWKIHIRRILRSPLASCKSKDQISDVVENNHHHGGGRRYQLVELFSPAQPRSPFIFRSPAAAAAAEEDQTYFITNKINTSLIRNKLPLLLSPANVNGRKCPPASPIISPLNNSFYEFPKQKKKAAVIKKKGRPVIAYNKNKYNDLFISDEEEEGGGGEDERAKLFRRRSSSTSTTTGTAAARRRMEAEAAAADDTLAVVKRSSDPYSDFRTSMVEMIVEKEIFATKDLQNLLHCFLSLNSCRHHKVIFQVFAEIWEALLLS